MDNSRENNNISKRNKAAFLAAFLLVLAALYLFAGIFFGFYIPCPFRALTGLKCPGCGMSHAATDVALAFGALIRSDTAGAQAHIMDAFRANALFIPIFAYLIYAFIKIVSGKETNQSMLSQIIDIIFLIIILIWWVVRNIISI